MTPLSLTYRKGRGWLCAPGTTQRRTARAALSVVCGRTDDLLGPLAKLHRAAQSWDLDVTRTHTSYRIRAMRHVPCVAAYVQSRPRRSLEQAVDDVLRLLGRERARVKRAWRDAGKARAALSGADRPSGNDRAVGR